MKRALFFILLAAGWAVFAWRPAGYCVCIEDKELDILINNLEQNIAGQEKSIAGMQGRYQQILKQKKQVLDLIEQDKRQFKEKIRGQRTGGEKQQLQAEALAEQKERLYAAEREQQIGLAFEKAGQRLENKDAIYLDQLIKKQRELCSTITSLQLAISDEEKNLKQLKESREFLVNEYNL